MAPADGEVWNLIQVLKPCWGAVNLGIAVKVGQIGMITNALKDLGGGRQPRRGHTICLGESFC